MHMEITTTTQEKGPGSTAINALAVIGFIVLILIGIALAVYAARYVPIALNRLSGTAAVSLRSEDGEQPDYDVVVNQAVLPFEPVATSSTPAPSPAPAYTAPPSTSNTGYGGGTGVTYGRPTTVTIPVTVPAPAPYGRPDLTVDITAIGYCTRNDADSFRRARSVPEDENAGFQFTVRNIGTNTSGRWDFEYELPTSPAIERTVKSQRSLAPNDSMVFTLCFTEPRTGNNREVTVRVDSGRDVSESNENNNEDSARIDIES